MDCYVVVYKGKNNMKIEGVFTHKEVLREVYEKQLGWKVKGKFIYDGDNVIYNILVTNLCGYINYSGIKELGNWRV